jgi:hypothetical protein
MDDAKRHHRACTETLTYDFNGGDYEGGFCQIRTPHMTISQKTVAILLQKVDKGKSERILLGDALVVWNWRSGQMIYVSFSSHLHPRL